MEQQSNNTPKSSLHTLLVCIRFDPRPRTTDGTLKSNKYTRVQYLKMIGYTPEQWNARQLLS
jgi:hypothetical protein